MFVLVCVSATVRVQMWLSAAQSLVFVMELDEILETVRVRGGVHM